MTLKGSLAMSADGHQPKGVKLGKGLGVFQLLPRWTSCHEGVE